jgi:hypothetical protein
MNQNILGIELVCTCGACPEQYDAFYDGQYVGYFRLRHGYFRVEHPDCGDETVLGMYTDGDGIFDSEERMRCLSLGCLAILDKLGKVPKFKCIKESPDYHKDGISDLCRCTVGNIYEIDHLEDSKFGLMLVISDEWHLAECFEEIHD